MYVFSEWIRLEVVGDGMDRQDFHILTDLRIAS